MKEVLLNKETLQSWAAFTIAERIELIRRVWGDRVKCCGWTLRRFYNANGIKFRTAKKNYMIAIARRPQLIPVRKEFAQLLGNIIEKELPLIYVDETTFNTQTCQRRSW